MLIDSDNNFDIKTAKFYWDKYKAFHTEIKGITLELAPNNKENLAIEVQDLIRKAFGVFVTINIKGYPANVFKQYRAEERFNMNLY